MIGLAIMIGRKAEKLTCGLLHHHRNGVDQWDGPVARDRCNERYVFNSQGLKYPASKEYYRIVDELTAKMKGGQK